MAENPDLDLDLDLAESKHVHERGQYPTDFDDFTNLIILMISIPTDFDEF